MLNMINTSPRTKILLVLYENKKIKISDFYKLYNNKKILDIRIKRLISSKQIKIYKKNIQISKNSNFLKAVIFIFDIVKKF